MTLVRPEDWTPQGVADLEDRAWEALWETMRSVCVTAGAGAGKTEFLAQKATYLLQTGLCPHPKRILAISFKRDAAETLAQRVIRRCPEAQARRFVSLTFDAFTKGLVDQFRQAIPEPYRPPYDYEISTPTNPILSDFLQRAEINDYNTQRLTTLIARARLLDPGQDITDRQREVHSAYWRDQYHGGARSYLTFPMINRLAQYLLRTNSSIRQVVRTTFPFVFLDEFQDATIPQYELLITAFDPAVTICTAVGDDKQRIMGWAGAMPDAFARFTTQFGARCISLLLNWRSHEGLVAIQHVIATRIDPNVERAVARKARAVDGQISAIWVFQDRDDEVRSLAAWIAAEVATERVRPHDIAVLVRMRADAVEVELAPRLSEHGIVLRNIAKNVGTIAIQDLLTENLTRILLPFLRLGSVKRSPEAWTLAQEGMQTLSAASDDDELLSELLTRQTEAISKACRAHMRANPVAAGSAAAIVNLLVGAIGEPLIRQSTPSYHRQADFDRVKDGFVLLLDQAVDGALNWSHALDRFEGVDQVPLMTIHKSKGMEFHTMIFFGLDSQSWWSLRPDNEEELSSFFVAFTRAEQRAFFTCCNARGGRIGWLEELLGDAVPRIAGNGI